MSFCVTMVRKAKKNYFNNLNLRNITDNKQFWKTVKLIIITLIKGEKVVSEDREVAEILKL